MKRNILLGMTVLLAGQLLAADSTPKDDVTGAAKKLADSANYSWTTTVVVPDDSPFKPGPTDGKIEKGGVTYVKMSFRDNTTEFVKKGEAGAFTDQDGNWTSITNQDSQGPARFMGMMIRNFKAPDVQATEIAADAKELKKDGDVYSSDLTEDGAKSLLSFRGGRRGGNPPTVTNPSGSVKFWVKDGVLTKFEFKVKGTVSFNGNDRDTDRDTTVEIKDVGTTKIDVPDAAKKLL